MKNRFIVGMMIVALATLVGCGGGSGSSTSSGSDVTSIDSLSDIPSGVLDPQSYDLTTSAASAQISAPQSASVVKNAGVAGTFSRAGCEMDRMKKNIIRSAKMPQMILCHMQQMETAAGGDAAGDGEFNYWRIAEDLGDSGPQGLEEFSPRMAIKKAGDVLTFVMCNGTEKQMEMVIGTANGIYEGHVVDNFGGLHQFQMDFSADGPPESFTTASFSNTFVEASPFWTGYGQESLNATPTKNTISGFYSEVMGDGTEFAGATYGVFDASQGTARYRQDSGTYPGETVQQMFQHCETMQGQGNCGDINTGWINGWLLTECSLSVSADTTLCFPMCEANQACCPIVIDGATCIINSGEGPAESFTIDTTDPYNLLFNVAATSTYEAEVLAASLPDSSAQPVISFTDASAGVDCSLSDSWDAIPFVSQPDMTACHAIEEELDDWDTGELCSIQDQAANGGEQIQ